VVRELLEIAEQRVAEDRVDATAEIARRSRAGAWTGRGHQHDLVWRRHRQPAQDQPVEQREDGGVDADAEGERQDRDARDQRPSYERANRVTDILKHVRAAFRGPWRGGGSVDPPALVLRRGDRFLDDAAVEEMNRAFGV